MEGIVLNNSLEDKAKQIGTLLEDKKGSDTIVLDMRELNMWTDYIIISTISSSGQLKGVIRRLKEYLRENSITILNSQKQINEDGWELIDCGSIVVNLMNQEKRDFYDLEKLWFSGNVIFHSDDE